MSAMQQTTPLLEQQRLEEQQALADKHNGRVPERRLYRAVWCVERMRKYLPPDQIALAHELQGMHLEVTKARGFELTAKVDGGNHHALEMRLRTTGEIIRTLAGFEQAALTRIGNDGRACFFGVIEGDGVAELARRVKYPPPNEAARSLRRLVQITLEALQAYDDENTVSARNWKRAP